MKQLHVEIVTQEEQILSQEVDRITLPALDGEITILPSHQSLTAVMSAGEIVYSGQGREQRLIVSPGFIQVADDTVMILADSAVREEDLDEQKAHEARAAAEAAMEDLEGESEVAMTLGTIERTIMEMRAINRRPNRGRSASLPDPKN